MSRERSTSPRLDSKDADMEIDSQSPKDKSDSKVIIITNLTRNVVESHLKVIFSFYGDITKVDLPVFGKSGQNRGKAALEFADPASAHKAASHMDGGQLDGADPGTEGTDKGAFLGPVRALALERLRLPPTDAEVEVQILNSLVTAIVTVTPSVGDHTAVEDLRRATCTVQTDHAPGRVRLYAEDLPTDPLLQGDVLQATPVGVMGAVDQEAIPFAPVALEQGLCHALAHGQCPTLVILVIAEAVAAQGL
ncbi:hypothetical protein CVT25_011141 [Psilocybe cyanescens]|uniref:RRM domain-containing protein n=1 Tax=Psilocybe cyanescens TaxID=93625 RepID=A0A409WGQ9_PSICY|nr:hypothetical protein CVT25_011141 [Psilocybe cyanescens]